MAKSKQAAPAAEAKLRAWFDDVVGPFGIYREIFRGPATGMSYATDGYIMAICRSNLGAIGKGPATPAFIRRLRSGLKHRRVVDFSALRRFAKTRRRTAEPVRLFKVCVDRRVLNQLLRNAPSVALVTVSTGDAHDDAIEIRCSEWTAYIMPYMADGRMPSFSRTVKP